MGTAIPSELINFMTSVYDKTLSVVVCVAFVSWGSEIAAFETAAGAFF